MGLNIWGSEETLFKIENIKSHLVNSKHSVKFVTYALINFFSVCEDDDIERNSYPPAHDDQNIRIESPEVSLILTT
jgi:hypothetical protein